MLINSPTANADARLRFLSAGVLCAVGVLIYNLHHVQVKEGAKYAETLRNQTTVPVVLSPARGSILDRNGIGLAENRASYDVDVYLRELVGNYSRSNKGRLPKIAVPWAPQRQIVDVNKILQETTGDALRAVGIENSYDPKELLRHYDQKPNVPFRIAHGLDFETLSRFSEHSIKVPGVQETARPVRSYNFGALASHILGYTGEVEDIPTNADFVPESTGKQGIERSFDSYLQGTPGGKILRKNNLGYILGVDAVRQPTLGDSVYLTIDVRIQHIVEEAMRHANVGRGAAVVMDPWTGDILAMVSMPDFDPNVFVPKVDSAVWKDLTTDPTHPLVNRALQSYPTGSIFKTIVAMAALKNPDAKFTANTLIDSPGAIWRANRWWKDWYAEGRGPINLKTAIQWSCNTFFYQLGARTGIQSIDEMSTTCGLGRKLLVDEDGNPLIGNESPGVVPGPEWMDEKENALFKSWEEKKKKDPAFKFPRRWKEKWSEGHTLNTSIGQGFLQASPLQMTTMVCAIANGGEVHQPRLVRAVTKSVDGKTEVVKEYPVRVIGNVGLPKEKLEGVRQGMLAVVQEGTGRKAAVNKDFIVAGKTGTAQFKGVIQGSVVNDYRTWFNGFAPYDQPRYAITVFVEGGVSGGGTCGPIVGEILNRIYEMEQGTEPDLVYLTPAVGHFAGANPVMYESTAPAAATGTGTEPTPQDFAAPTDAPDEMAPDDRRSATSTLQRRMR